MNGLEFWAFIGFAAALVVACLLVIDRELDELIKPMRRHHDATNALGRAADRSAQEARR